MSDKKPVDNRSASQKISDLENALMALYQTADNMARDVMTIKEAIKLLGNKVNSIVQASAGGEQLTDAVISRIMIENNCEELAQKVKAMVAQGVLVSQDQIADDSFVVGSEINEQGETVNPRLQFAVYSLSPKEVQDKLKGSKVGDTVSFEEGKLRFQVSEIYQIQQPQAPAQEAAPAEQPAAPESDQAAAPADAPVDQPVSSEAAPSEAAPSDPAAMSEAPPSDPVQETAPSIDASPDQAAVQ